jgi:N12 class adenine-specific DNA methylase
MMSVVEGKRPSAFSPVTDSQVVKGDDGSVRLETYNQYGGLVDSRRFANEKSADKADKNLDFAKDLNVTDALQRLYASAHLQQDVTQKYNNVANKGNAAEKLSDDDKQAVYLYQHRNDISGIVDKINTGTGLSPEEQQIYDAYSGYYNKMLDNSKAVDDFTSNFEESSGLPKGYVQEAILGHKSKDEAQQLAEANHEGIVQRADHYRTQTEQKVVDEYQSLLRNAAENTDKINMGIEDQTPPGDGTTDTGEAKAAEGAPTPHEEADESATSEGEPAPASPEGEQATPPQPSSQEQPTAEAPAPDVQEPQPQEDNSQNPARDKAYELGASATDDRSVLPKVNYEINLADARLSAELPDSSAVSRQIRNKLIKAVEEGNDDEADKIINDNKDFLTDRQKAAIESYWTAQEMSRGVEDSITAQVQSFADERRQQLTPYAKEDGTITPITLDDNRVVYYQSGDLNNAYGGIMAVDEDGHALQVPVHSIVSIGQPYNIDDTVSHDVEDFSNELQNEYSAYSSGQQLVPGSEVNLSVSGQDFRAKFLQPVATPNGDQLYQFQADDGSIFNLDPQQAQQSVNDANDKMIAAQISAEQQSVQDHATKARMSKGIAGYALGKPDLTAPQNDPKVAAEYLSTLTDQDGESRKDVLKSIQEKKDVLKHKEEDLSQSLQRTKDYVEANDDMLSDDEKKQKEAEIKSLDNQLQDVSARNRQLGAIRANYMDSGERNELENARAAKVSAIRSKVSTTDNPQPQQVPDIDRKYLLDHFDTQDDANEYIQGKREELAKKYRNDISDRVLKATNAIQDYVSGITELNPSELSALVKSLHDADEDAKAALEQQKQLKKQKQLLGVIYAKRSAEQLKELSPAEQRAARLKKAKTYNDLVRIAQEVYKGTSAENIISDMEPHSIEEYISQWLPPHAINWEGKNTDTFHYRGLGEELGLSRGIGHNFDTTAMNYFLAPKGKGESIDKVIHNIWRDRPSEFESYSDQDFRNAVLDIFMSYDKPTDITRMVPNNRIADAEQFLQAEEEEAEEYEQEAIDRQNEIDTYNDYLDGVAADMPDGLDDYISGVVSDEIESIEEERKTIDDAVREMAAQLDKEDEKGKSESAIAGSRPVDRKTKAEPSPTEERVSEGKETVPGTQSTPEKTRAEHNELKTTNSSEKQKVGGGNADGSLSIPKEPAKGTKEPTSGAVEPAKEFGKKIDEARKAVDTNPTDAQKEAGNYKKGHIKFDGYDLTIENPKGSTRSGTDPSGKKWSIKMNYDYGYILGTKGTDGDHIDVYLSDKPTTGNVYVVDQIDQKTGAFDEHKVMYGFPSMEAAKEAYASQYEKGWKIGPVTEVSRDEFKKWIDSSTRKTKPFNEYKSVAAKSVSDEQNKPQDVGDIITEVEKRKKNNAKAGKDKEKELSLPLDNNNNANGGRQDTGDSRSRVSKEPPAVGANASGANGGVQSGRAKAAHVAKRPEGITPQNGRKPGTAKEHAPVERGLFDTGDQRDTSVVSAGKVPATRTNSGSGAGRTDKRANRKDNRGRVQSEAPTATSLTPEKRVDDNSYKTAAEKAAPLNTRNYLFPEKYEPIAPSQRLKANYRALSILRDCLKEGRQATAKERVDLAKFTGWGGTDVVRWYTLKDMDITTVGHEFAEVIRDLDPSGSLKLLDNIKDASLTSYYTPVPVARAINHFLDRSGYKGGGRFLDGSFGSGIFEGTMPKDIQQRTQIYGTELDWLTAHIAQLLFPDANIKNKGFQDLNFPDSYFSIVGSNIPFGAFSIYDKTWKSSSDPVKKFAQSKIHNYFVVKNIDYLQPGGIGYIMSSNAIMDTPGNQIIRRFIADKCEILGAVRLPDNTFNGAGTKVVTDVMFLRKYKDEDDAKLHKADKTYVDHIVNPFMSTSSIKLDEDNDNVTVEYNGYYEAHPDMMIGDIKAGGQYRSDEFGLTSKLAVDDIAAKISKLIDKEIIPADRAGSLYDVHRASRQVYSAVRESYVGNGQYVGSGNIVEQNGKVGTLEIEDEDSNELIFQEIPALSKQVKRVRALMPLRKTLKQLVSGEIEGKKEDELASLRKDLKKYYNSYVSSFGRFHDKPNNFVLDDVDGYTLQSLEVYNGNKFAGLSDVFEKNTITPKIDLDSASNPLDYLTLSMAEYGEIRPDYMVSKLGPDWMNLCGDVYELPTGGYQVKDLYLSGDVKAKLAEAKQAAELDHKYDRNVKALEEVQPKDVPFIGIEVHMGARWVPDKVYTGFLQSLVGIDFPDAKTGVRYSPEGDHFTVYISPMEVTGEALKWKTDHKKMEDLFSAALRDDKVTVSVSGPNGERIFLKDETASANDKIEQMRSKFEDYISSKPEIVKELQRIFNDKFNTTIIPHFDGSHLQVPGLQGITLRPHQKDAVWMLINNQGGIIDHIVGAGKTLVMQSAIMEMRRMGIAKKPMIIALKSTVPQMVAEFRRAFPSARVLSPGKNDFTEKNRKKLLSKIALNDWDAVILSHEQYTKLPHTKEIESGILQEQADQLDAAISLLHQGGKSDLTKRELKGLETRKKSLAAKIEKILNRDVDNEFTFEGLGVDFLFVDECQQFKNLPYVTTHQNVAGLSSPEGSSRAAALLCGARYLQQLHQGDKGIVLLSGTTISNSLVELYNLFQYVRPNKLKELGISTFDAWASSFAVNSAEEEFDYKNQLTLRSRFRSFDNIPELSKLYNEVTDVRNDNNLILPKPKMHVHVVTVPASPALLKIADECIKMCNDKDGSYFGIPPKSDSGRDQPWALLATNISTKAAINVKLVDPLLDDGDGGKIRYVTDNVKKIYDKFNAQKGTQMIFCDLGVPSADKVYDVYNDIINRLVNDYGIPREEIVDIHVADTDLKKAALFKKMNDGDVRILIAGSKNGGTGVNVQKRMVAIHHVDMSWNPANVTQENGRGARQGNEVAKNYNDNKIEIFYYATEHSLDLYKYQLVSSKQKMIDRFKSGVVSDERTFDEGAGDDEDFDPASVVALLSGNPIILEKAKMDKNVQKLIKLKRQYIIEHQQQADAYESSKKSLASFQKLVKLNAGDIKIMEDEGFRLDKKGKYPADVSVYSDKSPKEVHFDKPGEAGKRIHALLKKGENVRLKAYGMTATIGLPEITTTGDHIRMASLQAPSKIVYKVVVSRDDTAAGTTMRRLLEKVISNATAYKNNVEYFTHKIEGGDPGEFKFVRQGELDKLLEQQRKINAEFSKLAVKETPEKKEEQEDKAPEEIQTRRVEIGQGVQRGPVVLSNAVRKMTNGDVQAVEIDNKKGLSDNQVINWVSGTLGDGFTVELQQKEAGKETRLVRITKTSDNPGDLQYRRMVGAAADIAEKLGGTPLIFEDGNNLPESIKDQVATGEIKGWFTPSDGSIHIYTPAMTGVEDVKRTVFHEKLGHEGLKALFGSDKGVMQFGHFVFKSAGKSIRERILDRADEEGYTWDDPNRFSKAAQEVFSDIAGDGPATIEEFSLWQRVKHFIINTLRKLGLMIRGSINDHDLRYYVLKTETALKRKDLDKADGAVSKKWESMSPDERREAAAPETMFRRGKPRKRKSESMAEYIERLKMWEKWNMANEAAKVNDDPMPDEESYIKKYEDDFRKDMLAWKKENGFKEDGPGEPPKRGEGESPQDFAIRVADYETKSDAWKGAPEQFEYDMKASAAYREDYEAWKMRYGLNDEASVYNDIYEGKSNPEPVSEEQAALEGELDYRMDQDLSEGVGVSPDSAKQKARIAIIERRKNIESASSDDATYIHAVRKNIVHIAKEVGKTTDEVAREITYLIEKPKRIRDLTNSINDSDIFAEHRLHITPEDFEECILPNSIKNDTAAMAIAINERHKNDPDFVPVSREFFNDKYVKEYTLAEVIPSDVDLEVTPEVQSVMDSIRDWYNYTYDWLRENNVLPEGTGYQQEYVNHIWDKAKSDPKAWEENFQRLNSPNVKKREISTYVEGMSVGLEPKEEDITKMMSYYSRSNIEAWANRSLLYDMSNINVDIPGADGDIKATLPVLMSYEPIDKDDYTRYTVPGIGDVWVLNEVRRRFASIFGTLRTQDIPSWLTDLGHKYDVVGGTMKKVQLTFSAFHMLALTEVAMAQMRPDRALKALFKYIVVDCIRQGTLPAYAHPDDFHFAAKHLVQLGATQDYSAADVNAVTGNLRKFVRNLAKEPGFKGDIGKVTSPIVTLLDYVNRGMDRVLWNYLHDGLKIACFKMFSEQIDKRVQKESLSPDMREKLLDEAGQYVNDSFGGQYWELLNVSPALLKWIRRAMLSPDWFVSTQRHFFSNFGFGSLYSESGFMNYLNYNKDNLKRAFGADIPRDEFRRFRSSNAKLCYLLGVCVFFYTSMNALNAFFRAKDVDKEKEKADQIRRTDPTYKSPYELAYPDGMKWYDYTMLGNTLGQQTHLFVGRYRDGSEWYARWGKQFREFPEMFVGRHGPEFPAPLVERMMGKANPVVGLIRDDLGALGIWGFSNSSEIQNIQDKYGKDIGLLAANARSFMPFSIPTQDGKEFKLLDLFWPSQKGFTRYKTIDFFKNFIQAGDMDGVIKTYKAATMNNIDAEQCLKAAIATLKAAQRDDMTDGITDLPAAFKRFDKAKSLSEKKYLRNKIVKFLAASSYKTYTRDEAEQQVKDFINGTDVAGKESDKYILLANADDIRDDYKLNALKKKAYEYVSKVKEVYEGGNTALGDKLQDKYMAWFQINQIINEERSAVSKLKHQLGGANDKEIMQQIRSIRKEAQKALDSVKAPK